MTRVIQDSDCSDEEFDDEALQIDARIPMQSPLVIDPILGQGVLPVDEHGTGSTGT